MNAPMKQLAAALKAVEKSMPKEQPAKKQKAKRKKKSKGNSQAVPGTSVMRAQSSSRPLEFKMTHREWLATVKLDATKGVVQGAVYIAPNQVKWLAGIAKSFEKYHWNRVEFEYIPDVGTTKDGSVAVGIDFGSKNVKLGQNLLGESRPVLDKEYDKATVMALTPSLVTPLWNAAKLVVPPQVLQTRRWYDSPTDATVSDSPDYGPGFLAYYVKGPVETEGAVVGDVWISYSITFTGTRLP